MLGAVTAAKAAAGSRTLVRLAALLALTTVCRAGQDGRPAPPRPAPAPAAAAAPPRRAAASVRGLGSDTSYTTQHPVYTGHCTLLHRTPCVGGTYAGQGSTLLPRWPGCRGGRMVPSCCSGGPGLGFLLLCLAPPPPRPRPGDWGCC